MKKFILYIVFICACFNSLISFANSDIGEVNKEMKLEYTIKNFAKDPVQSNDTNKIVVKNKNSLEVFLVLPFIIDKVYEGDDIFNDVTPLMKLFYPSTDEKTLGYVGEVLKTFVIVKREYRKIINKLEYNLKAKKILPKDAPIIAKNGEYVKDDEVLTPSSSPTEYKITNNLHKYLEYDKGELGEPVRMRDKNYIPSPDIDELTLAILDFDIRRIRDSIEKMPQINDGSAEKPYIGPHDLKARILLDTALLGDKKTIFGAIEISVPNGYYINGDVLNKNAGINFNLKEIEDEDLNIQNYQFFMPLANGVEKNGIAKRVLVDKVLFPFVVNRKDIDKKLLINGDLFFELCSIDGGCQKVKTEHSITMKDTPDDQPSFYYNYVTQAHAKLPKQNLKHAHINNVIFDKNNRELKVFIKHKKKINNISVMVEDEKSTNFLNPRYEINENLSIATFDIPSNDENVDLSNLAISVSLNDKDFFRTIDDFSETKNINYKHYIDLWNFLIWGLGALFLPGVFYVVLKLILLINIKDKKIRIFFRYFGALFVSLLIFIKILEINISDFYPCFVVSSLLVVASLLFSILGYMDFSLFRPFKGILKHGYVLGVFTSLIFVGFPILGKNFVFNIISIENNYYQLISLLFFCLGLLLAPLILLIYSIQKTPKIFNFNSFNALYNFIYILIGLYYIWQIMGGYSLLFVLFVISLLLCVWYYYPILVSSTTKGKVLSKSNIAKFNTIKFSTFIVVVVIFISSYAGLNNMLKKKIINPSIEETTRVIDNQLKEDRPVLVAVSSEFSLKTMINKMTLIKAEDSGLTVAYIDNFTPTIEGKYWLNRYKKEYSNLYILFSNRYKQGIVLPSYLPDVDFKLAIKNFN